VLTLVEADGAVWGMAYAIERPAWPAIEAALEVREQQGYVRLTVDIALSAGERAGDIVETVPGLLYVATARNPYFIGPEPLDATADVVRRSHGEDAVREAEAHFTRVVREHTAPDEMADHPLPPGDPVHLPAVIAGAFDLSTSEARRMIAQGGVKIDGAPVGSLDIPRADAEGRVLQAGKRRFARLVAAS